jgi:carboxylate-amine ligase
MRELFDLIRPELDRHGDLEMATVLMGRLRSRGTGAARQRAVYARQESIPAVIDWLADQTRLR